jgi:hypothetical protein
MAFAGYQSRGAVIQALARRVLSSTVSCAASTAISAMLILSNDSPISAKALVHTMRLSFRAAELQDRCGGPATHRVWKGCPRSPEEDYRPTAKAAGLEAFCRALPFIDRRPSRTLL